LASFDPPTVVRTSGDQTIGGVKTFSSPPVVPAGATGAQAPQAQEIPTLVGITGAVVFYPATTAPPLWLKANGAAISRTTYAALWAYAQASGNLVAQGSKQAGNFGEGDGSTTFTLPDLRGEFPRGWDDGRGVDTGRAIGTAQAGEVQAHTHPVPYNLGNGTAGTNGTALTGNSASAGLSVYGGIPGSSSTGGAETRPRNVALLACIKY
jgi:phage-related tail fiber protein